MLIVERFLGNGEEQVCFILPRCGSRELAPIRILLDREQYVFYISLFKAVLNRL